MRKAGMVSALILMVVAAVLLTGCQKPPDAEMQTTQQSMDAAKSADLGGDPVAGTLILDFNFAFQPSCAFDPKWACPLAPPANRLDLPIRAGERLA